MGRHIFHAGSPTKNHGRSHSATTVKGIAGLSVVPLVLICFLIAVGSLGVAPAPSSAASGKHEAVRGYLPEGDIPDSLALLPPPPVHKSAAFAADAEMYRATRALRGTPRWTLAAEDANLTFPEAVAAFSCAINAPITEKITPHLYSLLLRMRTDVGGATDTTKEHYRRVRPFVVYKETTCSPDQEARHMKNGSYPSSHASIGWAWALVLAEIVPDRTNAILARGYAFGQSRVVCGMHWLSDVTAGRTVAAGVVARLHAEPAFRAEVEAAKADIAAVRGKNMKPLRDCKAEAAALAYPVAATP